jgi:hypothetical protein
MVLIYDWQGGEFAARLGAPKAETREEFFRLIDKGYRIICYCPDEDSCDLEGEEWEWFCNTVFDIAGKTDEQKLIVADEVDDLTDPYNVPKPMKRILKRGRRLRMDTIFCGGSANALHSSGRDQVSELYQFRNIDDNALKFATRLKVNPDEVSSLDDGEFIHVDCRKGTKKRLDLWRENTKPA